MAIDVRRLTKLEEFLKAVTPGTAARLAQAVEFDRLRGGALPHAAILDALRPHLRTYGRPSDRVMTAQRLVCVPFADVLIDGPRRRKQRGRIARSSIEPVWGWLARKLGDEGAAALDAITAKLMGAGADFVRTEVTAFHKMAADAILAAPDELATMLGPDQAGDALDMARLMQIGEEIRSLHRSLPRPIRALDEDSIWEIRGVWEEVLAAKPDCAPYLVFFVLGRLEKPWEVMRLAGALSRKMDDILISRTDVGNVGELLLSDLEDCVETLASLRADLAMASQVLGPAEVFSTLSTGMVRELGIKRDGQWGRRLMAARSGMAAEMERLLGRAFKDISVTLPMSRRAALTLRARRMPDMAKRIEPARAARAIEVATIVAGCRPHAVAGAFAGLLAEIDEKVADLLRRYTEEMIDELRAVPENLRPQAAAYVAHATELTRILLGAEEAELIRRRSVAAIAAQHETARHDPQMVA